MKTIKFFCDAFFVTILTISLGGFFCLSLAAETTFKSFGKEFPGYRWDILGNIMRGKNFTLGYTEQFIDFFKNNELQPCIERGFIFANEYGRKASSIKILVRIFESEDSLRKCISLDRKIRPPYWDMGVVGLIEFEEEFIVQDDGRKIIETRILKAERKEKNRIINILTETLDMSPE